eukprot:gene33368-41179_t
MEDTLDMHLKKVDNREAYLNAHCSPSFHGVYEANSHVYLPYSISALLNLFDFCEDSALHAYAYMVVNLIVEQVLLTTPNATGICNLSASMRAFSRTRLRNWGHNLNQLINLLNGFKSGDLVSPSAITDFIVTSTWRPNDSLMRRLDEDQCVMGMRISHSVEEIRSLYSSIPSTEVTPFYWSAGLILHPDFTVDTKRYQNLKQMQHNKHLWPLSWLSEGPLQGITDSFQIFSK